MSKIGQIFGDLFYNQNNYRQGTISLAKFKTQVTDFARPNRFLVEVHAPSILTTTDIDSTDFEFMTFMAQTASLPARTQTDITIKYHGMELKLPGDYSKENLSITFMNDYEFIGRYAFELWMERGIQKIADNNNRVDAITAITDSFLIIKQIGRVDSEILAEYKFYDVFPTSITAVDLDMSQSDQVEKYTVTFAYSYFENMDMYGEATDNRNSQLGSVIDKITGLFG